MKTIGIISTAALALLLGVAAPSYAQDDKDQQQQEQKDKPADKKAPEEKTAKPEEKAAPQPDKNTKQEEKNTQQEDKNKQQEQKNAQQQDRNTKPEEKSSQQQDKNNQQQQKNAQQQDKNNQQQQKSAQQAQRGGNQGGRIPDDRFQANFGRQHSFHVSQSDYSRDRRFEYGGYSFGFVDAWPTNWLYTQNVYVIEIDGVYYLCNASYPGVNVALSINL
jgi:outer membrane biosynthesis protein TonB